jgi:predicted metal-dependent peptidase
MPRRDEDLRARKMANEVEMAVAKHPFLGRMVGSMVWMDLPHGIRVRVMDGGTIHLNRNRRFSVGEWLWWIGHARLHIALGHPWDVRASYQAALPFAVARCLVVNEMLFQFAIGKPPEEEGRSLTRAALPEHEVERLCAHLQLHGVQEAWSDIGGVQGGSDVIGEPPTYTEEQRKNAWHALLTREYCAASFASAIRAALQDSIDQAAGIAAGADGKPLRGPALLAARWIRAQVPVIGALLDRYELIEDIAVCRSMDIVVAAVCDGTEEIYLNAANIKGEEEYRFVIAHELLHAGLRHGDRCAGRDPEWWNAACDFVINAWLIEMGVGRPPAIGGLFDPALKGLSAEQVYDRIQATMKLRDVVGFAAHGDIRAARAGQHGDYADLDQWCRNAMLSSLELHQAKRGELPMGLVEAIRALAQPPIPWDVELARWFEREIPLTPQRRSYARPSRRQQATPDLPRPRWVPDAAAEAETTFAAVIDTSASMDRQLLGKALGAIASYAISREVGRVRVVFCDAAAYDAGWMVPEQLLERVPVQGRGGTRLQPGIDLVEQAEDFPKGGPVLIITDGFCDKFTCRRNHAVLTPVGAKLPFVPRGEVFRLR